jgi:hypothetical protein
MAETYKKLGSVAPTDNSEQTLYTTPASTETLVSNITVTNRSADSATFDIAVYDSSPTRQETVYDFTVIGEISGTTYNEVHRSTDGLTWTTTTAIGLRPDELDYPSDHNSSLTWWENEQKYIVVANSANYPLWQSTDATTWKVLGGGDARSGLWTGSSMYNDGWIGNYVFNPEGRQILYVPGSNGHRALYSTDGGTLWTLFTLPYQYNSSGSQLSSNYHRHSAYGNGKYVVLAQTSNINTVSVSDNVMSWTTKTLAQGLSNSNNKLVFAKDKFFAWEPTVSNPIIQYSKDGENWSSLPIGTLAQASGNIWTHIMKYKDGYLFHTSNANSYYSTDLFTWSVEITGSQTIYNESYLYNGKNLVYVTSSGNTKILTYPHTPNTAWDDETTDRFSGNHYVGVVREIKDYSAPTENVLYTQSEILPNETLVLETGVCLSASATIGVRENFVDNTTYDGTTATSGLTFSTYGVELS